MRITASYGDCSDGTCPAIHDTNDEGILAFQGAWLTDPQALGDIGVVPAHEGVVLLPRALVEGYMRERGRD
jgi:hypothetical protein